MAAFYIYKEVIAMLEKHKKVRLTGRALSKMNDDIHERDNNTCIIKGCSCYVPEGVKFHHEPCGSDKEDRIECGLLLCYKHHNERHAGRDSADIKRQCIDYLRKKYG